jgi:glucan biosynthesis protein C
MTAPAPPTDRLHGLDAVRGYALMLGVVFHATMSFLPGQSVWLVSDTERTPLLGGLFFVSHIFRMTTFFLIAGFFAHMTFHKRGPKAWIIDRLKRIGLPLVIFWPIIIASILLAAGYAVYVATGTFPTKPPPSPASQPGDFPLTHLWFLYVLLLLYAATLAVRGLVARFDRSGDFRRRVDSAVAALVRSPLSPAVLAIPAAAVLVATPTWLPWFGIPTPDTNIVPNLPAWTQFFTAFGFGWVLHRQPALLETWTRRWALNLAVAVALTAGMLAWMGLTPVTDPPKPGAEHLVLACGYALCIWTWTFGVIGAALRFLSGESPARRYIADSSYWIYIVHLPLVIVLQAAVSRLDWPWELKFTVVLGVGFAIMFATYELLVRHTFIGGVLNGRRIPWKRSATTTPRAETA